MIVRTWERLRGSGLGKEILAEALVNVVINPLLRRLWITILIIAGGFSMCTPNSSPDAGYVPATDEASSVSEIHAPSRTQRPPLLSKPTHATSSDASVAPGPEVTQLIRRGNRVLQNALIAPAPQQLTRVKAYWSGPALDDVLDLIGLIAPVSCVQHRERQLVADQLDATTVAVWVVEMWLYESYQPGVGLLQTTEESEIVYVTNKIDGQWRIVEWERELISESHTRPLMSACSGANGY